MASKVKSSKNYDYFQFLGNNRGISQRHVREIEQQFEEYGNITEVSPITVNKDGFILDGQHRFTVCKKLGLPVNYIEVDMSKELTPAMNSHNRAWTAMDYIQFFAAYKPEYKLLLSFIRSNNIKYPIASAVIFTGQNRRFASNKKLKDGVLEVKPFLKLAQRNIDLIAPIQEKLGTEMFEPYVRALVNLFDDEKFSLERFHTKLDRVMRYSPTLPNPRLKSTQDVMRNIESIYNYNAGEKSRVLLFR